jgi:hypothetical protein
MAKCIGVTLLVLSLALLLGACGPDTIFLRPALDTPAQHVKNGHSFWRAAKSRPPITNSHARKAWMQRLCPGVCGSCLGSGASGGYRRWT